MCGLLAIVETPESAGRAARHGTRGEALIDRVSHRGPDQRGTLALANAWLGHRRLAIVSPDTGMQPCRHGGTTWIRG